MLNYDKIHSCINKDRTPKTLIAKHLVISESTLRDRLKKENLTPNDLWNFARFFNKPMEYFFNDEDSRDSANEPGLLFKTSSNVTLYNCPDCIEKEKTISDLRQTIALQNELLENYRPKKEKGCG